MKSPIVYFLLALLPFGVFSQTSVLQSGPMLGYSEMREVMIWAQTTRSAKVKIRYWNENPKDAHWTSEIITTKEGAFTAHLIADEVEPGLTYQYEIYIDGRRIDRPYPLNFQTIPLWQYRTDPPAVRFAVGSCMYVNEEKYDRSGTPYGGDYGIFNSIYAQKPDLMVWLGDNTYLREPDWNTRTGIVHRYTRDRSLEELQPLLGSTHHYATWDDHDYGPNDADASFIHKDLTREIFTLFWGNPTYGTSELKGVTTAFNWSDLDFFMLDDRWYRSHNDRKSGNRQIIGEEQFEWLISSLKTSRSPFKFVCIGGQVLNDLAKYENYIYVAPEERQRLLDAIQKENIKGVIFLSGDRHHTELSKYTGNGGPVIYDFTVSPLTATAYESESEANSLRVKGSQFGKRNFSILEVTGPLKDRVLKMTVYDTEGQEVWSHQIRQTEL